MPSSPPPVIHWFRRDLRILDNTGLLKASNVGRPVIPLYIVSNWSDSHNWTGAKRQHFLCESLKSLNRNLETIDGRLIVRGGEAVDALLTLADESGANAIFFNRDPDPFGKATERRLQDACKERGIECRGFHDHTLHTAEEILTQSDQPYRVFTPYSKNWLGRDKPKPGGKPKALRTPASLDSNPLPSLDHWSIELPEDCSILPAGERAAHDRLKRLINKRVENYADLRDVPSADGTSRLSQDLRFGLISIRTVYQKLDKARQSAAPSAKESLQTYIKELAWREFYMAILHHYPHVLDKEFMADWRGLPWDEPGDHFEAWKRGKTGFPIVDAGIRELLTTGFMHNRVRMIVAMFLTKDLHIDWRLGESFFMQHLVDGEIASNNGGWQWSAGTGADAAPYFRIQNPWSQSKRHDPEGNYIKRWIPELKDIPAKRLHSPPEGNEPLAKGYSFPCVDHSTERAETLARFKRHRQQKDQ